MIRRLKVALGLILIAVASKSAFAAGMSDYLLHGYAVLRITNVAGPFLGCQALAVLTFADGSRFSCAGRVSQLSLQPRVYILRRLLDHATVVVIGSQAIQGSILQLGDHPLVPALRANADDPTDIAVASPTVSPPTQLDSVGAVRSINQLQNEVSRRLNDAQDTPIPYQRLSGGHP